MPWLVAPRPVFCMLSSSLRRSWCDLCFIQVLEEVGSHSFKGSDVLTVMTKFRECPFLVTVLATLDYCSKPLTKGLIDYLEVSDQDFKGDLTAKICSIVEKLSPDKLWYIDQMLKVLCEVTENDAVDVIELAINRHTSDLTTRSMCLIALLKLSSRFPSCSQTPTLSFTRPFGCPVTILNTIDHLGKFNGKADEGFFVGYSLNSKAFRVFNSRTRIVEENLHIRFSENTSNIVDSGPDWLFDIDALTRTMNYEPIVAGTQSNGFAGTKVSDNAGQARKETEPVKDYILLPLWTADPSYSQDPKSSHDDGSKPSNDGGKKFNEDPRKDSECNDQEKEDNVNRTNNVIAPNTNEVNAVGGKTSIKLSFDPNMHALKDVSIFDFSRNDEDDGAEADMNNLDTTI
ncbi:ribonuclease H-like domain-containing protein [Tanacetum coccineum]|uniref:Ribonuclease H-like domain-containing protein n=1 Tax=Tanacetum coccineum TaxID=301880 RepID=A0ABQ5IFP5_9ASTR